MRINHNIAALNTYNKLSANTSNTAKSLEKLSSGLKINKAGDDAAGLAISEKMRGQIRGLDMASKNANDGISLISTAEGALNETHSILQRMRELAVQSANDTNTLDDRKEMQKEVTQLKSEIDRISEATEFNTLKLLNGSLGAVGTSSNASNVAIVSVSGLKTGNYDVTVTASASVAIATSGTQNFAVTGGVDVSAMALTINGTTIDFSNVATGSTALQIADHISTYTGTTGVAAVASGNFIRLEQTSYGSEAKIDLGGGDAALFGAAGTAGVDAVVTITDVTAATTQTVTGLGRDISYKSAEFTVAGANGSTATISVTRSGASLQIGANEGQNMLIDINEMSSLTLGNVTDGYVKDIDIKTKEGANEAITVLDKAMQLVSGERAKLGSVQNRLEHTINNLGTTSENLAASESRIRDVDMAKEMMEFTKNNILSQAAQAMLAQANQQPQSVLQLLQ